jgi:hypothetical protein
MNKKTETIGTTDSIQRQVVALLSRLGHVGVRKIKFGQQRIELSERENAEAGVGSALLAGDRRDAGGGEPSASGGQNGLSAVFALD